MTLLKKSVLNSLFVCLLFQLSTFGQYKKGLFLYPIHPGKTSSLTGNYAELRSNHFHGGIDIRTGWASGVPVLAAQDGWVSLASMQPDGYGNKLHITHPDGFVTVYAHLETFLKPVQDFVRRYQYQNEIFQVDIPFNKNIFKVKRGDTIGISGNTGSSKGPHLHFEIRDTADNLYNPLLFEFEEVTDKLLPYFSKLAARPLDINGRVEGLFERQEYPVVKQGKDYYAKGTVKAFGLIGLEMIANDRISNGSQRAALSCIEMKLDGEVVYYQSFSKIPFSLSNHVNHYMDYAQYKRTGEKFQKLYAPDGLLNQNYLPMNRRGKLRIQDQEMHEAQIHIWDAYGNESILHVKIKGEKPEAKLKETATNAKQSLKHETFENTLKISVRNMQGIQPAFLFFKKDSVPLQASYQKGNETIFLYDLRKGLPDSLHAETVRHVFHFQRIIPSKILQTLTSLFLGITFQEKSLFDTLYLEMHLDAEKGIFQINDSYIPLAAPVKLSLPKPLPFRNGTGLFAESVFGEFKKYVGHQAQENSLTVQSKYLGRFKINSDTIAPVIRPAIVNRNTARFNIYDGLSGIKKIRATLNGKFVLMVWDKKQHLIYSEKLDPKDPFIGDFQLEVSDAMDNVATFRKTIL